LAIALVVAVVAVLIVVRPIGRSFQRTIASLSRFSATSNEAPAAEAPVNAGLDLAVERFKERMVAAHVRIEQAEKQLDDINI
jgi:hypothetical protein